MAAIFGVVFLVFALLGVNFSMGNNDLRNIYRGTPPSYEENTGIDKNSRESMLCKDVRPQHSLDMTQLMGMWYGNEIIMHTADVPGVHRYESCVVIHLSDVTDQMQATLRDNNNYNNYRRLSNAGSTTNTQYNTQQTYNNDQQQQQQQQYQHDFQQRQQQHNQYQPQYNSHYRPQTDEQQQQTQQYQPTQQQQQNQNRYSSEHPSMVKYLRLVWSEGDDNLEYTLNYTIQYPGLWTNVGEQRGSWVALNKYTQFSGTVQVVKAVNDHLVLTFCGSDVKSSIYTVVLSRHKNSLTEGELNSIRTLLENRGLYRESVRKVCNGAITPTLSASVCVALLGLLGLLKKYYAHYC